MATMTVTSQSTDITAYGSRLATLEVAGISLRNAHQTITVPLNRLSQRMQQIHRQGGRIISVHTGEVAAAMPSPNTSVEELVTPSTATEAEQELSMETPHPSPAAQPKHNHQSSKKKRR